MAENIKWEFFASRNFSTFIMSGLPQGVVHEKKKDVLLHFLYFCPDITIISISRRVRTNHPYLSQRSEDFQPFNLSTFQPCNLATFQPFNLSTLQPSNLATFQPDNLKTLQPCNLATSQPFNLSTLQPCNPDFRRYSLGDLR